MTRRIYIYISLTSFFVPPTRSAALGDRSFAGMTNIGRKPTVSDSGRVGVETYIYDFNEDVYGKLIEVKLLKFMRPEMKFDGVEQLKAQIHTDIEEARN